MRKSEPTEKQAEKEAIRVLLADDHKIVRNGLALLLNSEPDIEVVAEAADGLEAVAAAQACDPQVVVMDLNMPEMKGDQATRLIKEHNPNIRVIALSMYHADEAALQALSAGVDAYLSKGGPGQDLIAAVRELAVRGKA